MSTELQPTERALVRVWQWPWCGVYGRLVSRSNGHCLVERMEDLGQIEVSEALCHEVRAWKK